LFHYIQKDKSEQHESVCCQQPQNSKPGEKPFGDPHRYIIEDDDVLSNLIESKTGTYCRNCKNVVTYEEQVCTKCFLLNPQLLFLSTQFDLKNFAPAPNSNVSTSKVTVEKYKPEDGEIAHQYKSKRDKYRQHKNTPYDRKH